MKKFYSSIVSFVFTAAVLPALTGCSEPKPGFIIGPSPAPAPASETYTPPVIKPALHYTAGESVKGRSIKYSVIGEGPDVVLVISTIHGNENAGTPIARTLLRYLEDNRQILEGRKVVVLPIANPDGYFRNKRGNSRGVDLNRNFAAANRINNSKNGPKALSEPEARVIKSLISRYKPARIITFHEPLNCIDYDGPARALAQSMGRYTKLPVKKLGGRPGSLGSYAGTTLGIPTITVELTPQAKNLSTDQLWDKYGKMTLSAITYPYSPPTLAK